MLAVAVVTAHAQGVNVLGKIVPNSVIDTYPTHVDSLGRGGFVAVSTWQERNSIPTPRRKAGMMVSVKSATVDSLYRLGVGLTNADWLPYSPTVDVSGKANVNGGNNFTGTQSVQGSIFVNEGSLEGINITPLEVNVAAGNEQTKIETTGTTVTNGTLSSTLYNGGLRLKDIESGYVGTLTNASLTASRNWTLPDAPGTLARIEDLTDKASLSVNNEFYGENAFYNTINIGADIYSYGSFYSEGPFWGTNFILNAGITSGNAIDISPEGPLSGFHYIKVPQVDGTLAIKEINYTGSSAIALDKSGYYTLSGVVTPTTYTLPAVAGNTGKKYTIINVAGPTLTVSGAANTILIGATTTGSFNLANGEIAVLYNNSQYWIKLQ